MKKRLKKLLRPLLFTLGGALAGLAYYYLVGCSSGSCAITSNPLSSMLYLGLAGLILPGASCPCCGKASCDTCPLKAGKKHGRLTPVLFCQL